MTDLLSRPSEKTETREDPGPRPLAVGAALAAAAASLGTLLTCMAVCVVGWFLADAGAHGQTTDALRVGADMWLLGHGSGLDVAGTPVHVVPLALTALLALAAWRLGRWAAATSAPPEDDRVGRPRRRRLLRRVPRRHRRRLHRRRRIGQPESGSRHRRLARGLGGRRARDGAGLRPAPRLARPGAGLAPLDRVRRRHRLPAPARRRDRPRRGADRAGPEPGRDACSPSCTCVRATTSCTRWSPSRSCPTRCSSAPPTCSAPASRVGTGTVVSPSLVALGPVPAFPLLSALPDSGPTPAWVVGLVALPVLAGAGGAVLAQRRLRRHRLRLRGPARLRQRARCRARHDARHRGLRRRHGHRPAGR